VFDRKVDELGVDLSSMQPAVLTPTPACLGTVARVVVCCRCCVGLRLRRCARRSGSCGGEVGFLRTSGFSVVVCEMGCVLDVLCAVEDVDVFDETQSDESEALLQHE